MTGVPHARGDAAARVVVIGGGITGLTAAYRLLHPAESGTAALPVPEVVLLEGSDCLGGKILSTPFEGRPVDEGADAFLLRVPWAAELCAELGISPERISPSVGGASVLHSGARGPQLTPLPTGLVGGVPTRLGPLVRSPLLGPAGALRAAADCVVPRRRSHGDPSVGDIVRGRLGSAVAARVVDPLLGSISAGDIDQLDAATSAPILLEALGRSCSLMRGLRSLQPVATQDASGAPAPIFGSFAGGMGRLVEVLRERLDAVDTSDIRLDTPVTAVRRTPKRLAVDHPAGTLEADAVIVAVPAHAAASMLLGAPEAAAGLAGIDYASVAVLTLGVRAGTLAQPAQAGFLVARDTGWLTTACSFGSAKWPQWSGDGDGNSGANTVLRVSVGRADDDRHTRLSDSELRDAVLDELSSLSLLGGLSDPSALTSWRVSRWEHSLPQYRPGHGRLVDRIEAALTRELPGVVLAGAAYRGLGIPACIRQGNDAALAVVQQLGMDLPAASP